MWGHDMLVTFSGFLSRPALKIESFSLKSNFKYWVTNKKNELLIFDYQQCFALNREQINLFLMCMWVIWSERNNILCKYESYNPIFMASWVVD